MPLIASSDTGGNFQLAPQGLHVARCVWVIDLGTQNDTYQGKPKIARKVRIGFELPTEKAIFDDAKGEEPFFVGKEWANLPDEQNQAGSQNHGEQAAGQQAATTSTPF